MYSLAGAEESREPPTVRVAAKVCEDGLMPALEIENVTDVGEIE
jgi:hypothetical protein